jgi:Polyketide cyclase / dehydrase and lipid transport
MAQIHVATQRTVAAPQKAVWELVADYEDGRPRYLPSNYVDWRVETGGHGAGTTVAFTLRAARRERPYRLQVEETEPGTVLVERDTRSSLVNTWTLEPVGEGRTTVKVATEWQGGSGIRGFMERTFAPSGLRRIYDDLLERLARTAEREAGQS